MSPNTLQTGKVLSTCLRNYRMNWPISYHTMMWVFFFQACRKGKGTYRRSFLSCSPHNNLSFRRGGNCSRISYRNTALRSRTWALTQTPVSWKRWTPWRTWLNWKSKYWSSRRTIRKAVRSKIINQINMLTSRLRIQICLWFNLNWSLVWITSMIATKTRPKRILWNKLSLSNPTSVTLRKQLKRN